MTYWLLFLIQGPDITSLTRTWNSVSVSATDSDVISRALVFHSRSYQSFKHGWCCFSRFKGVKYKRRKSVVDWGTDCPGWWKLSVPLKWATSTFLTGEESKGELISPSRAQPSAFIEGTPTCSAPQLWFYSLTVKSCQRCHIMFAGG